MEVKRTMTVDVEMFEVGDVIKFKLTDGEKVRAKAVKETPNGMLFVFVDCLAKEYPMFKNYYDMDEWDISYINSDFREVLNGEILARFPDEIRNRMTPVNEWGDMLRLPTEKEIFGKNIFGESEDEGVKQWKSMKNRRNRIAFQGKEGAWKWYWLMNRHQAYAFNFVTVDSFGNEFHYELSDSLGVRPVFLLS